MLNDIGIIGEAGSEDMVLMMEFLMNRKVRDYSISSIKRFI